MRLAYRALLLLTAMKCNYLSHTLDPIPLEPLSETPFAFSFASFHPCLYIPIAFHQILHSRVPTLPNMPSFITISPPALPTYSSPGLSSTRSSAAPLSPAAPSEAPTSTVLPRRCLSLLASLPTPVPLPVPLPLRRKSACHSAYDGSFPEPATCRLRERPMPELSSIPPSEMTRRWSRILCCFRACSME